LIAIPLPQRAQPTVRYEIAVVRATDDRAGAHEFVADVLSTDGRRELKQAGFGVP
jgi:ABC-type molybdate transport system substrate-binding protein